MESVMELAESSWRGGEGLGTRQLAGVSGLLGGGWGFDDGGWVRRGPGGKGVGTRGVAGAGGGCQLVYDRYLRYVITSMLASHVRAARSRRTLSANV